MLITLTKIPNVSKLTQIIIVIEITLIPKKFEAFMKTHEQKPVMMQNKSE